MWPYPINDETIDITSITMNFTAEHAVYAIRREAFFTGSII